MNWKKKKTLLRWDDQSQRKTGFLTYVEKTFFWAKDDKYCFQGLYLKLPEGTLERNLNTMENDVPDYL